MIARPKRSEIGRKTLHKRLCVLQGLASPLVGKDCNRDSPDNSRNWHEYSRFSGLAARLTRGWMATSSSGSPNDGRGADLAIFTGIWTHSFCRLRLNA